MKRIAIPMFVAVVAGGAMFTAASASAQGYNDYPSYNSRSYGYQQNQSGTTQPDRYGQSGYDRSSPGNYRQNGYGGTDANQDTYGRRSYGQDNYGPNYRSRNGSSQRYGAGQNDSSDRYSGGQNDYSYQNRGEYRNNQPNSSGNGYGLGRTYRPGSTNGYQSDDND